METPKYIKVDGVSLNVEYVKGLRRADFIKSEQIRSLFHKVPEAKKDEALSTVYTVVTGREKRGSAGGSKPPETTEEVVSPE